LNQDSLLFLAVFTVWILLALVYAVVPMFAMPGYAAVWGYGSLVFLGLAVLVALAVRRRAKL
jgi:hypothetical protein